MNTFAAAVTEKIEFYVYLLIDPRDEKVFYVGKGTGDRCFDHIVEARKTQADAIGDYAKLARIREIENSGATVHIDILRHGLSESDAFFVESVAIDLLEPKHLTTRILGRGSTRMSVGDINALYGAKPVTIHPSHRVVLIRINRLFEKGMFEDDLYEATRKWWRIHHRRRELKTMWAPQWAMAVFGGVVRAVYRIESWEQPSKEDLKVDPNRARRWAFRGTPDQVMEELYLHRDVWSYLRDPNTNRASQNPVRYVNCSGGQQEPMQTEETEVGDVLIVQE